MLRFFLLSSIFLALSFHCAAQSYLGKSKEEIQQLAKQDFEDAALVSRAEAERPFLQIKNGYETLYYYLKEGVCTEFVVVKPYSCNCLETDFNAYQENCLPLSPFKWVSKDYSKIYQMSLNKTSYSLSIVPNSSRVLSARSE